MGEFLDPGEWDKVGAVSLCLFLTFFHLVAYLRGWLVPGPFHREMVARLKEEIAGLKDAAKADDEIMLLQQKSLAEKNVGEQVTNRLLESVRELVERRGAG